MSIPLETYRRGESAIPDRRNSLKTVDFIDRSISLASAVRNKQYAIDDVIRLGISPYYPHTPNLMRTIQNETCLNGFRDIYDLIQPNADELKAKGLLTVDIVGSAAFGLCDSLPYGCRTERTESGYILRRTPPKTSDIDVQVIAKRDNIKELEQYISQLAETYRKEGKLRSDEGKLSITLFSYEDLKESLLQNPYPAMLVNYLAWDNFRLPLIDNTTHHELKEIAKNRMSDNAITDFFWGNLADRYLFGSLKLGVKMGLTEEEEFVSFDHMPSLGNPSTASFKGNNLRQGFVSI